MGFIAGTVGFDIGTFSTKIINGNTGDIFSQPSFAAIGKTDGKVVAVGNDAAEYIRCMADDVIPVNPISAGTVHDFDVFRIYLRKLLREIGVPGIIKSTAVIASASGMTNVQKRVMEEAALTCGIKTVKFVNKSIAAASGCGIGNKTETIIVDIGYETVEIGVISLEGVVSSKTVYMNEKSVGDSIINFLKREHGIVAGRHIAERVKIELGTLCADENPRRMTIYGRDVSSGLPKKAEINSVHLHEVIKNNFISITNEIRNIIEITPPEIINGLRINGIILTGGNSKIKGLSEFISSQLGIKCICTENPCECVVRGLINTKAKSGGKAL